MKKFIKKIGKGIKKVGKAIGKPFKKLLKTKIGKIIGTIGMMMMGGWMLGGAKTFVGSMFTTGNVGTAFTKTMASMGAELGTAYSSVTGAVKGIFTGGGTSSVAAGSEVAAARVMTAADAAAAAGTATPTVVGGETILAQAEAKAAAAAKASTTTKVMTAAEAAAPEAAALEFVGGESILAQADARATAVGIGDPSALDLSKVDLPKIDSKSFLDPTIGPDLSVVGDIMNPVDTPKLSWAQRNIPRIADAFGEAGSVSELYDNTLGIKPFGNTNAPKFVQGTDLAELKTGYTLLQKPEEQYQQGASDMSGAYAALDVNSQRLYTGNTPSMATLMDGRTSIPSPSVVNTETYTRKARDASFLYDSTLIG